MLAGTLSVKAKDGGILIFFTLYKIGNNFSGYNTKDNAIAAKAQCKKSIFSFRNRTDKGKSVFGGTEDPTPAKIGFKRYGGHQFMESMPQRY